MAKNDKEATQFVSRKGKDLVPPFVAEEQPTKEERVAYVVRDAGGLWVASTCTMAMADFLVGHLNGNGKVS